jgi:hypothetical protein
MRMRRCMIAAVLGLSFLLLVCSKTKNPVKDQTDLKFELRDDDSPGDLKQCTELGQRSDSVLVVSDPRTLRIRASRAGER